MPRFAIDDRQIEARVWRKPTLLEAAAIAWCVCLLVGFAALSVTVDMNYAPDFRVFIDFARGDGSHYYYGYWSYPLMAALAAIPSEPVAFVVWGVINLAGVIFATRVFGGNLPIVLTSYSFGYVLFYGQITGVIAAGIALTWWGLARGRPWIAGVGLVIALVKYHVGLPIGLAVVLLAETSWYNRITAWVLPLVVFALSLIAYPGWVETLLYTYSIEPPIRFGSIGLWSALGPIALLLWLPPSLLPRQPDGRWRGARFVAFNAASALALPYFQHTGLVGLYVLPIGAWGLLGNIGYAFFWWIDGALDILIIVPLVLYALSMASMLRDWLRIERPALLRVVSIWTTHAL